VKGWAGEVRRRKSRKYGVWSKEREEVSDE